MKALFSLWEWHFSLRWIRGILAIRRRACVPLRRGISWDWACDTLAQLSRGAGLSATVSYWSHSKRIVVCRSTPPQYGLQMSRDLGTEARSVNICDSKAKYYLCVPVLVEYEGHSWHKQPTVATYYIVGFT